MSSAPDVRAGHGAGARRPPAEPPFVPHVVPVPRGREPAPSEPHTAATWAEPPPPSGPCSAGGIDPSDGPTPSGRTERRWLDDPVESGSAAGFGIYLHIPFCAHRCGYCDFATYDVSRARAPGDMGRARAPGDMGSARAAGDTGDHLVGAYVRRLVDEVDRWAGLADWPSVTSVFIGGGTPTLLPPDDLATILTTVADRFDVAVGAEVTVEANPETVDGEVAAALVGSGVGRVSLGAQSSVPHVLEVLERRHRPERVAEAVATLRAAGIAQVSVDLIYGTPGESDADWERSLTDALALGTDHLSAYALTVADNTPFGRSVARGAVPAPDPDVQRRRFDVAREVLADWDHYEISNWTRRPVMRSRHNTLYWRHGDYLGLGVGAHGHLSGHRWWNHRSIERWLEHPVAGTEDPTTEERATERLMLGLRLRDGLHPADVPPLSADAVQDATDAGLLQLTCGRFQATDDGWFLLDELLRRLT